MIRLGKAFADISTDGEKIMAGAAAADINIARRAADAGIGGLEFMVGIPGTLGGALRMNAGAYGTEIADVFDSATALDADGTCGLSTRQRWALPIAMPTSPRT